MQQSKKKICCVWSSFLTNTIGKEWAADQPRAEEREARKEKGNPKGYACEALQKSLPDHSRQPKKPGCILKIYLGIYVELLKLMQRNSDCRKTEAVKIKYQPPPMVFNCLQTHSLPTERLFLSCSLLAEAKKESEPCFSIVEHCL